MDGTKTRTWGDGATDKRVHVIEDISYAQDFILCRCGVRLTNIQTDATWKAHRGPDKKAGAHE